MTGIPQKVRRLEEYVLEVVELLRRHGELNDFLTTETDRLEEIEAEIKADHEDEDEDEE